MVRFMSLSSGSCGNCYYLGTEKNGIVIDAGVSLRRLKKVLQECVDNENKRKPLTDDELVELMSDKGYKVARRTIAKYRDQLGIPKARLRKEL